MWKRVICIGMLLLFAGSMYYFSAKESREILSYHFKGEVKNVRYDRKGFPYVTIEKTTYYLSYNNWAFEHQIQNGDTLEKKINSFTIKLTKYKSGDVTIFK
ncbi:hypothetical protein HDF25_001497 [Pedobacter cryoconitis]|uniref:DUF1093 domain-containing protein n=1 Tax=Pedobacter cryoconitis TaxID=188932 RepID=A0A7X0J1I7_9SPHI|nr:hypothetical protein [Pedobacter cryoconitis]